MLSRAKNVIPFATAALLTFAGMVLPSLAAADPGGAGTTGGVVGACGSASNPCRVKKLVAGPGGVFTDGGFVSSFSKPGTTATGEANFNCVNNPASSSPCTANFTAPYEIGGFVQSEASSDFANIYVGAVNQTRTHGPLFSVLNSYGVPGLEKEKFRVEFDGDTTQDGHVYCGANKSDCRFNSVVGGMYFVGANGALIFWNKGSQDVAQLFTGAGTQVGTITATGAQRYFGVAHTALGTCNAGAAGTKQFCTTHGEFARCDGTAWAEMDATPPVLMGTAPSPGTAWDGTNTRTVITQSRDWTATHISSIFSQGSGGGTANFTCSSTNALGGDAGVCSFPLKCAGATGGCPDAGSVCLIYGTGQCSFAAKANVLCTASGTGCVTTQPSSIAVGIYGTTGSANN